MNSIKLPPAGADFKNPAWQQWFYLLHKHLTTGGSNEFEKLAVVELVAEKASLGPCYRAVKSISADYSMVIEDTVVLVDATAGNIAITLPPANSGAANYSTMLTIRRIDATGNTVTVSAGSTDQVDSGASITIAASKSRQFEADGSTNWYTVGVN